MSDALLTLRPNGPQSFLQAVDEIDASFAQAVDDGVRRVLLDVRGLTGFASPDLAARAWMLRRGAATSRGRLKVAMVCAPEWTDGERFGVVLARSLGIDCDVFEDDEHARDWLDHLPETWHGPRSGF